MPDSHFALVTGARKDPEGHRDDVRRQLSLLGDYLNLLQLDPASVSQEGLVALLKLMVSLSGIPAYKDLMAQLPSLFIGALENASLELSPTLRLEFLKALIGLGNKGAASLSDPAVLACYFDNLRVHDKETRAAVVNHLIVAIRAANRPSRNPKLNATIQRQLINTISGTENRLLTLKLLQVAGELYRRRVWDDERTVGLFADLLLRSNDRRVISRCLNFFLLVSEKADAEDDEGELDGVVGLSREERIDMLRTRIRDLKVSSSYAGDKTRNQREMQRAKTKLRQLEQGTQLKAMTGHIYDQLRSPSDFADGVIRKFLGTGRTIAFPLRLQAIELISKVTAYHELAVPEFYQRILRYVVPRQKEIIAILQYSVACVNKNTAEEDAYSLVSKVATDFVHSGSSDQAMTVGLTCIAEICKRCPGALTFSDEAVDLLNELVSYSRESELLSSYDLSHSKTQARTRKGVTMAARNLLNTYRILAPNKLRKKFLGRELSKEMAAEKKEAALAEKEREASEESIASESELEGEESEISLPSSLEPDIEPEESEDGQSDEGESESDNEGSSDLEVSEEESSEGSPAPDGAASSSSSESSESDSEGGSQKIDLGKRLLTDEELERLRQDQEESSSAPSGVDLEMFVPRERMTREEKARMAKEPQKDSDHKGSRWRNSVERKRAESKSLTNAQKHKTTKNMMMLVQSRRVRQKQLRSQKEKLRVKVGHIRNQKRGITHKVKR